MISCFFSVYSASNFSEADSSDGLISSLKFFGHFSNKMLLAFIVLDRLYSQTAVTVFCQADNTNYYCVPAKSTTTNDSFWVHTGKQY